MRSLTEVPCPYCGAEERRPWAEENGYTAVRCAECSFVYVSPRPADVEISEAAKTGLHDVEQGQMAVIGQFHQSKVRMFEQRLPELFERDMLRRPGLSWLDIGAGFGELLLALRGLAADDAHIEGVEPCLPKVEKARSKGLRVDETPLEQLERKYDVISLVNVFSHLPDPGAFLRELKRLLKPEGALFLVTGNAADIGAEEYPRPYYLPDHLVFAGERHVTGILEQADFDVIRMNRYRDFHPENKAFVVAKNVAKIALGRPHRPMKDLLFPNESGFRSLFVRAQSR
ncbi:MAG: class I SAM-dependent methyltransferase [Kiloniellales bacterium]